MQHHQILVVGGGAGGIAVARSLMKRRSKLDVAIVEPSDTHYYQPGFTMVGGGIFHKEMTARPEDSVFPAAATRYRAAVSSFEPDKNQVTLKNGDRLSYDWLIAAPGLKLDWDAVPGLSDALGKGGVTSNYRYDLAPYTWELVQGLKGGNAIFTQPPMPIKCAGAPQKAMYLSCSEWEKQGVLGSIDVTFANAGPVLFGVEAYAKALMPYVERYGAKLAFGHNLKSIDGAAKRATFATAEGDVVMDYDMLHVTPPQCSLDFVRNSPLANDAGWIDVDQTTLQHNKYANVFSLGDAMSAPNAKTAAAARKQAPIVAENLLSVMGGGQPTHGYDGYGSCPLTVENGKVILAEFGYGGKLLPSFPWDSTVPRKAAWFLKARFLPWLYWNGMLKGREWLAGPKRIAAKG